MKKPDLQNLLLIAFHIVAFMTSSVAFGLIMQVYTVSIEYYESFTKITNEFAFTYALVILSYTLGFISLFYFLKEWRQNGKVRLYLSFLWIFQILFLVGNSMILYSMFTG